MNTARALSAPKKSRRLQIRDVETGHVWSCNSYADLGPMLLSIRMETPSGFNYKKKEFIGMTRQELVMRINSNLRGDERAISAGSIARIENGLNVYGGYLMRVMQITRALRLTLNVRR
jgi:hypothetical protein